MVNQFNAEIWRLTIFWAAASTVATGVGFWVLYVVIKAAVRDGMREAMAQGRGRSQVTRSSNLPEMRAD